MRNRLRAALSASCRKRNLSRGPGEEGRYAGTEWFPSAAFDRLCRTRYAVTPESNRMGYRLRGAEPLPRDPREMISDDVGPPSSIVAA